MTVTKKQVKLGSLRTTHTESQEWLVHILGRYGYSYKYIAKRVFKSKAEHKLVGKILRHGGVKVTEYRNGLTKTGKTVANGLVRDGKTKRIP